MKTTWLRVWFAICLWVVGYAAAVYFGLPWWVVIPIGLLLRGATGLIIPVRKPTDADAVRYGSLPERMDFEPLSPHLYPPKCICRGIVGPPPAHSPIFVPPPGARCEVHGG